MVAIDELLMWEKAQTGKQYRAAPPACANPLSPFFDCAGLQCAARHQFGLPLPGGAYYMNSGQLWAWCVQLGTASRDPATIAAAANEPGWWLFVGPNGDDHIAMSIGNRQQFAAHSPALGVGPAPFDVHNWFGVARQPNVEYAGQPVQPEVDMTPAEVEMAAAAGVAKLFTGGAPASEAVLDMVATRVVQKLGLTMTQGGTLIHDVTQHILRLPTLAAGAESTVEP